jgi:methyl-accepting chemotaxis protein
VRSRGFKEYRGLGWLVTVRQPAELAFAPVQELRRAIARWGFVFVCAFGVTSWLFAGRIARNLHRVTAASERIRTGDILSVMPRPRNESEYARMCTALGNMVDDLRRQQESLAAENNALKARESAAAGPPEPPPSPPKRPAGFNPW